MDATDINEAGQIAGFGSIGGVDDDQKAHQWGCTKLRFVNSF
jgi:hypothetical protein